MKDIFNDAMKEISEYYKDIEESAQKSAKNITNTYQKTGEATANTFDEIAQRVKKSAQYSQQYFALLEQERFRSLSAYEKKQKKQLKANMDYYEDLRDKDFENLKNSYQLKEISEQEYYARLAQLRDAYFVKGSSDWAKYSIEILKYNEDLIAEQSKLLKDAFSEIDQEYEESFNNIMKKQETMHNKLTGISDIYNRVSVGSGDKTYTWLQLSNIESEVEALKEYNSALMGAKERVNKIFDSFGLDEKHLNSLKADFFAELTELDIGEGIGFSNYLMNISDSKLTSYLEKWVEKMNLSEIISKTLYYDEADALVEAYTSDLTTALTLQMTESLSGIPDYFYENGSEACTEFRNGFMSAIDSVMLEISTEIENKLKKMQPDILYSNGGTTVTNNSNFTIYESDSPELTALEIYKQDTKKRMLVE